MDHLACFVPGMLMLGPRNLPQDEVDPQWETLAAEITKTCYQYYKRSPSGLSPEFMRFDDNDIIKPRGDTQNLLRPEVAEAIYYMWYYTGDPEYRNWAFDIFDAFQLHSK